MLDYLIRHGRVIDGTGNGPRDAHVGLRGDRVAYLGVRDAAAREVIDAGGMVVSPGFIDTHGHSEFTLLADGRAEGKISQGVTTEINGNCGLSAAPLCGEALAHRETALLELDIRERWTTFSEYFALLKKRGMALNFVTLCGHGNVRASVIGYDERSPRESEVAQMKELLYRAVQEGARGLSTGLIYPPGMYAATAELAEIAGVMGVAGRGRGIYATHMRDEGDGLIESIEEALTVGRQSGTAVHISHLKTAGERAWPKIEGAIALIEGARGKGITVTCDRYPYVASSTDLDSILPSWVFDGGVEREVARLSERATRNELLEDLRSREDGYWRKVHVSTVTLPQHKWMEGLSVHDASNRCGTPPPEFILDLLRDEKTRVGAIFFTMSEDNLERFLSLSYLMIGSDSSVRGFSGPTVKGKPHPRAFGTFPRFIGVYVRDRGIMGLSEAIRRMTSLPATTFGLEGRGVIREGHYADIVVFDYGQIADSATFDSPYQRARGVSQVFVNGIPVVRDGECTGDLPGRILR
jgi:N-acyl-D-amino-acid deacylase